MELSDLPGSAADARAIGARYYFTGKHCRHGHIDARYVQGGACAACTRIASALKRGKSAEEAGRYANANAVRLRASKAEAVTYVPATPCKHGHSLRWVSSNNCVECDRLQRERRRELNKDSRVRKLYGLTPDQHEALFVAQNRSCKICEWGVSHRRELHIDHCHKSSVVRGLLCSRCNQGIGLFADNPHMIRRAADYVTANTPAISGAGAR